MLAAEQLVGEHAEGEDVALGAVAGSFQKVRSSNLGGEVLVGADHARPSR